MDFDLFDIEIALKLTAMILKRNYTCSQIEVLMKKLHMCLALFHQTLVQFFINTSRAV